LATYSDGWQQTANLYVLAQTTNSREKHLHSNETHFATTTSLDKE